MADKLFGGVKGGSTSLSLYVVVRKKADNTEATGIVYNTAGNIASYCRGGAARTAITLVTQTVTGAFSSGGFVEIDATNMPGLYRLDVPDAALATGVDLVTISFVSTSNYTVHIQYNISTEVIATGDAYARLGAPAGASVSADVAAAKVDTAAIKVKTDFLPSATAGATGGVFIAGTNAATAITTALTANITGNVTGNLSGTVGSVTGAVGSVTGNVGGNVTGSIGSVASAGIAAASLATAAKQDIADFVLDRSLSAGTDSGTDSTATRTVRQALRVLRNKAGIAASVLTVTKEDDTTTSWTAAVTTTAGNPISDVNPT